MVRVISPIRLHQRGPQKPLAAKKPFSLGHPMLFQVLTAPLWMILGTTAPPAGPKGNPNTETSGEITIPNTPAATAQPRTTMKVDPLPPSAPGHEAKVAKADQAITKLNEPKFIRSNKRWKTIGKALLVYALPIAIGAALPIFSVYASIGTLFPFLFGKSAAAVAGTLLGSNALLGLLTSVLIHFGALKLVKRSAKQVIYDHFRSDKDLPALAEALLPYTRTTDGSKKTTINGETVTRLFVGEHRQTIDEAIDRVVTSRDAKTVDLSLRDFSLGSIPGVPIPEVAEADKLNGILGYYVKGEKIGAGGMGEVFGGKNSLGELISLKFLPLAEIIEDAKKGVGSEGKTLNDAKVAVISSIIRFLTEAELGQRISHPNLAKVIDTNIRKAFPNIDDLKKLFQKDPKSGKYKESELARNSVLDTINLEEVAKKRVFIVAEFVADKQSTDPSSPVRNIPAPTLADYFKGKLDADMVKALFLPLLELFAVAHEAGIAHRDIKPKNLLVTEIDGRAVIKVIDLGVARDTDKDRETAVTQSGDAMGTVSYMPPLQYFAEAAKEVKMFNIFDIYSLGTVILERMLGKNLFDGLSTVEIFAAKADLEKIDFKGVEPEMATIIQRMISPNLLDNFTSMREVIKAFKGETPKEAEDLGTAGTEISNKLPAPPPVAAPPTPKAAPLPGDKVDDLGGKRSAPPPSAPPTAAPPAAPKSAATPPPRKNGPKVVGSSSGQPVKVTVVDPKIAILDQAIKSGDKNTVSETINDIFADPPEFANAAQKEAFMDQLYDRMANGKFRTLVLDLVNYLED